MSDNAAFILLALIIAVTIIVLGFFRFLVALKDSDDEPSEEDLIDFAYWLQENDYVRFPKAISEVVNEFLEDEL